MTETAIAVVIEIVIIVATATATTAAIGIKMITIIKKANDTTTIVTASPDVSPVSYNTYIVNNVPTLSTIVTAVRM
ncbi:MAG: hypothetical protein JW384_01744 [Nitrosomonadaceae bacterium]|nr:hypothetical protein [Nitrosomonadaceae bacterium]